MAYIGCHTYVWTNCLVLLTIKHFLCIIFTHATLKKFINNNWIIFNGFTKLVPKTYIRARLSKLLTKKEHSLILMFTKMSDNIK